MRERDMTYEREAHTERDMTHDRERHDLWERETWLMRERDTKRETWLTRETHIRRETWLTRETHIRRETWLVSERETHTIWERHTHLWERHTQLLQVYPGASRDTLSSRSNVTFSKFSYAIRVQRPVYQGVITHFFPPMIMWVLPGYITCQRERERHDSWEKERERDMTGERERDFDYSMCPVMRRVYTCRKLMQVSSGRLQRPDVTHPVPHMIL